MITISIDNDGDVTISQESLEERIAMSQEYAELDKAMIVVNSFDGAERPAEMSEESKRDEDKANFFKSGWDAAIRESQLRYVSGGIEDFWNEQIPGIVVANDDKPDSPEPLFGWAEFEPGEETKEDLANYGQLQAVAQAQAEEDRIQRNMEKAMLLDKRFHVTADSGEPALESAPLGTTPGGVWTLSQDELDSRLEEAYRRGRDEASRNGVRQISAEGVEQMLREITEDGTRSLTYQEILVGAVSRLGFVVNK